MTTRILDEDQITAREAGTLRRLDRKIMGGKKVSHADLLRAIDLKRKKGAAAALRVDGAR